jgi:hypothetical protein
MSAWCVPTKKLSSYKDSLKPSAAEQLIFKRSAFHFEMPRRPNRSSTNRSEPQSRKILRDCAALKSAQSLPLTRSRLARWLLEHEVDELRYVDGTVEKSMKQSRDFSSIRLIAPVSKFGIQMPLAVSPTAYRELNRLYPSARRNYSEKPFSPDEMKHNFAIRALKKPSFFARRPYIYLCVRCQQIFLVNERRGSVVALDRNRNPLPEPENSRQVATFEGPCPSFRFASKFPRQRQPATTVKLSRLKLGLLRILASLCPELRGPGNIENASKRAQAMPEITPQEFLF